MLWKRKGSTAALVTAALVAALSCGGCTTGMGIEAAGKKSWNQEGAPELTKKVVMNRSSLTSDVEIVDMKNAMAGNIMKAQVSLRSKKDGVLPLQYKFDWYDADGIEIAANAAWKPILFQSGESKTIQGVAPDPRAQEFKLKLRDTEE